MASVEHGIGEEQHLADWKRYQEFLQSWTESSLNESDWTYKRVKQRSLLTCKRYNIENRAEDIFRSSLDALAKEHFERGRSLDSYLNKVVTSQAVNLKKKTLKEELSEVIPESGENVVNEIFRKMSSERNIRRLLLTKPNLQRDIITRIITLEKKDSVNAPSPKEVVHRLVEDLPDFSIQTVSNLYENLKATIKRIETVAKSYKDNLRSQEEGKLLAEIAKISAHSERQKYDELYSKFEEGALSPEENEELIELSDQMEILDAQRLELLSKLADLRGTSLKEIVQEYKNVGRLISPNPGSPGEIRAT